MPKFFRTFAAFLRNPIRLREMIKQLLFLLGLFLIGNAPVFSQSIDDERILFTVADKPVSVGEFVYIYDKTNGDKADYSRESLEEYLDLYVKFKLKVARARAMQVDTIQSLQNELEGYRRQLADNYLIDRTITDGLVRTVYDRMQQDVSFSHILVKVSADAPAEDTLRAYQKAQDILKQLQKGGDFGELAAQYSEDASSKDRGGKVGYFTAPFPNGFHQLEAATYETPPGKVVGPCRTSIGYHLVRVDDRRTARGEMEVAHILIRTNKRDSAVARQLADSLHQVLEQGEMSFDAMANTFSEDGKTSRNNGYIGFFGISQYQKSFEDAAFGLERDGSFSEPVQSSVGYHIIKRISRRPIQPFNVERRRLETRIKSDARFAELRAQLLEDIKQRENFRENEQVLKEFTGSLTDTFFTFRWKAPAPAGRTLFTLGADYEVSLSTFADYLARASRQRAAASGQKSPTQTAMELYDDFVDDQLLKYEESKLEENYPEFRSLMREYEEGILLFEATKMEVWDKAAQDSAGLQKFFDEQLQGKYRWGQRARTTVYTLTPEARTLAEQVRQFAKGHTMEETLDEFNAPSKTLVTATEEFFERSRKPALQSVAFEAGTTTEPASEEGRSELTFLKIEEIVSPQPKTLDEARGYAIADYQDELERRWVEGLRKQYAVEINKKVFDSLVKKQK